MTDPPLVQVPIAGTRPNRAGRPTARWVVEQAAGSGVLGIEAVGLPRPTWVTDRAAACIAA
ncbi:hypothetical protein G3I19_03665 [Streptomyces sp. SID10853]|uniref:hypothetical protein n=1 Tax=Streptomyces sp. SID10853 TaxID=2706028 RepID=UPI0013C0DB29|nr:hypothetical protein [Streptomyces sp. SID10853]NDZ77636.1 hypothetical protein [Streptomyces sp. SID10853]